MLEVLVVFVACSLPDVMKMNCPQELRGALFVVKKFQMHGFSFGLHSRVK
jgi:hypothetical protein